MKPFFALFLLTVTLCATSAMTPGKNKVDFARSSEKEILELMKMHFDLSVNYLYTSTQYAGQTVQRPGMAKELMEQSDSHWEDGIDILKHFLKRGGNAQSAGLDSSFFFTSERVSDEKEKKATKENLTNAQSYMRTLEDLLKDSKHVTTSLNEIHKKSNRADGEWAHYAAEKLEKEAGRTREMTGHITNLKRIQNYGLGLHFFDAKI